ncbi:hypothetical protein [Nocardia pneumoniae]|uniref:hypothetical protein n=1 Tax=Nocardia pneumoniae TaxID=228601 RepID=UPI00030726BA|nr:hypothetical protein [Nocardia pneumoniae]
MHGAELVGQQVARRASLVLATGAARCVALGQGLRVPMRTDTLSVPIGTRHDTLGTRLRPVPVAAPGELYLSGVQLAQGDMARSELAESVTAVAQVPGNERLGGDDDFCTSGGNSSVAAQVVRPAAEPNCPLGVRDVSTARTVAERGELVERAGGSGGASLVAQLRAWPRPPLVPLSPARRRVDNPEAIAFELPELSVSSSTLDTGATTLDVQLMVTENPAGAGLGEGSAPAGIRAGFPSITPLDYGGIVARCACRPPRPAQAADLLDPSTDHRQSARGVLGYAAGKTAFADSAQGVDSEGKR